jgi:CSLREA domain-containing protein
MRLLLSHHFLALLIFPLAAQATVVTTTTDEDDGNLGGGTGVSLREAVKYSPAGDTVTFAPALSGQTIRLTLGEILMGQSLTIDGSALPVKITLSGDKTGDGRTPDDTRVINISTGVVVLDSLVITGGYCPTGTFTTQGGGIYVNSSTTRLTIRNSAITGNYALRGGGIYNVYGPLIIETSTLSGNSCAIYGGGIYASGTAVTVRNSTITGNSAGDDGGGIYLTSSQLVLIHATITRNSALSSRGGIYSPSPSTLSFDKSIIAGNTAPFAPDFTGTFTGKNNLTTGTPRLAPLGDYGGPTQTMPPLPGSPAIDAGSTTTLTTDQRGFARVSTSDIGATEYQGNSDITHFWPLDFDGDASPYGTEQALGTDPLISDPANSRNITAPILNASGHPVLSFGIGAAVPGTSWVLCRSTDLLLFTEIYRFNGSTDTAVPGVTFLRTATGVTVTDTTPPPGGVFYRFEAQFQN